MIFEEKLADHYHKIANHLNTMVPVPWKKIVMLGVDTGDSMSGVFYFFTPDGKHHRCHKIPEEYSVNNEYYHSQFYELLHLNSALRKEFVDAGQPPWCAMTLTLEDDGTFDIQFEYGIYDEVGPSTAEVGWAYERFGINLYDGAFQEYSLAEYSKAKRKYEKRKHKGIQ